MYRILSCLFEQHNLWLVALAALICTAAFSGAAFVLNNIRDIQDERSLTAWSMCVALLIGGGAWATHFVAMLAYETSLPTTYNIYWSIASALIGIGCATAPMLFRKRFNNKWGVHATALLLTCGAFGLHYAGMAGVRVPARTIWSAEIVVWSFLVCAAFSWAGAFVLRQVNSLKRALAGCGLLAVGVVSLHFTGMGALTLIPDPTIVSSSEDIHGLTLAFIISLVLIFVLLVVVILALTDAKLSATRLTSANRMRRLANASLDGVVIHDGHLVQDANDIFASWLGVRPQDLPGRTLADVGLAQVAMTDRFVPPDECIETTLPCAGGALDVELSTHAVAPGTFATAVHDLSARRRADIAERENLAKSNFMANMSHELRTPLYTIISYAEMIAENAEADNRATDIDDSITILNASKHLLELISEILDISKIEAGKMQVSPNDFSALDLLNEVAKAASALATKNANTLTVQFDTSVGIMHSDQARLRQCLLNLLSNAAKFTSGGDIFFSASLERRGELQGVRFEVRDTGVGISPEALRRIFQPFSQADETITRKYGGTGLGLSITKQLAGLLGGDVDATSVENVGSTFGLWVLCDLRNGASAKNTYAGELAA